MKNFTTKFIFIFALLFTLSNIQAQTFPYLLVTETDTYTDIQEADLLSSDGDFWDDPEYLVPIGFTFDFFGENVTELSFVGLGGLLTTQDFYTNDSVDMLLPYIDDLIDIENVDPTLQSTISYTVEGTSGSLIFKLEWKDCGFYNEVSNFGTIENRVSLQMWLYEGTNDIEFRFGPNNIVNPDLVHDYDGVGTGIINSFTVDQNFNNVDIQEFWHLSGDPIDPSIVNDPNGFITYNLATLDSHPANGQVYRFLNPATSTDELRQELAVKVYPTIVTGEFSVEVNEEVLAEKTKVFVHNNLGQEIYNNTITDFKTQLDASRFSSGIYYVTVMNENGKSTEKLIKE